jgi:hypothetical protein
VSLVYALLLLLLTANNAVHMCLQDGSPNSCSQPSCLPIYFGDRWNEKGPGSVGNASYVWLPFVAAAGSEGAAALQLVNPGGPWKISDYQQPAPSL